MASGSGLGHLAYAIRKSGGAAGRVRAARGIRPGQCATADGALMLVLGWYRDWHWMVFAWARSALGMVTMWWQGLWREQRASQSPAVDHGVGLAVDVAASRGVNLVSPPFLIFRTQPVSYRHPVHRHPQWRVLGGLVCKILGDRLLAIPPVRQFLGAGALRGVGQMRPPDHPGALFAMLVSRPCGVRMSSVDRFPLPHLSAELFSNLHKQYRQRIGGCSPYVRTPASQ
jgi:hypothetical protein